MDGHLLEEAVANRTPCRCQARPCHISRADPTAGNGEACIPTQDVAGADISPQSCRSWCNVDVKVSLAAGHKGQISAAEYVSTTRVRLSAAPSGWEPQRLREWLCGQGGGRQLRRVETRQAKPPGRAVPKQQTLAAPPVCQVALTGSSTTGHAIRPSLEKRHHHRELASYGETSAGQKSGHTIHKRDG